MSKKFNAAEMQLPPEINAAAWIEWCEDRRERGKALTQRAAIMTINKLAPFSHQDQANAIGEAIMHGWTGVFPKRSQSFIGQHTDRVWADGL